MIKLIAFAFAYDDDDDDDDAYDDDDDDADAADESNNNKNDNSINIKWPMLWGACIPAIMEKLLEKTDSKYCNKINHVNSLGHLTASSHTFHFHFEHQLLLDGGNDTRWQIENKILSLHIYLLLHVT